jgi:DNA-binding transcriptional LysR family regulator
MTLKQLEAFYWAAISENFLTAADRLHVSVSSLSKRLTELEQSLRCTLFDRSGHRAKLTDAGQALLPQARQLLEAAAAMQNTAVTQHSLSGQCAFGMGELSALTWMPRFITAVRKAHPGLTLAPHVDIGSMLEDRLDKGELEFAVIAGRSSRSSIVSYPLTQARFTWVVSPRLFGSNKRLAPDVLKSSLLTTLPPGAGTTRILDEWLLARGITGEQRLVCNHWGAIAGLLTEGVGIGFLPEGMARTLARRGELRILRNWPPLTPLAYAFQTHRDNWKPLIAAMHTIAEEVADFSRMEFAKTTIKMAK